MSRLLDKLKRHKVFPLLRPLTFPYAIGVGLKNCAYDRHWLQSTELSWPVISVGNLSVGGSGKTPLVCLLADRLSQRGWNVDILSRGYGRSSNTVARVDAAGTPEEFGDEPLLMARHGLCVYVGANRYHAGRLAEQKFSGNSIDSYRLHFLDDGFQHRKLARAVDIVLLRRADLDGRLLPAGRLRESLSGLRRADIYVLREEDADLFEPVLKLVSRHGQPSRSAYVWIVQRQTTLPAGVISTDNALAFCAIGDAAGFFDGLTHAGLTLRATIALRDHHLYSLSEISRLKAAARHSGANCFVTTEKDSMRLPAKLRAELESYGPLIIAGLELSLREENRCIDGLESLLQERLQPHRRNVRS